MSAGSWDYYYKQDLSYREIKQSPAAELIVLLPAAVGILQLPGFAHCKQAFGTKQIRIS